MKEKLAGLININDPLDLFSRISMAAFCILLIDCAVTGGGHWFLIGPLSFRMLFGLIAILFSLPAFFMRFREIIKSPIIISFVVFFLYLVFCAFIGILNNNRMDVLRSDLFGFSWLFLVPVAMVVITSQKRLELVFKCLVLSSVLQALMITAINLYCLFNPQYSQEIFDVFIQTQMGYAETISDNLFRIFTKSSPYLIVSVICMIYLQIRSAKFNWFYAVGSGLCLGGLLLTFTRSIYGAMVGIILAVILYFFFTKEYRKRLLQHIAFGFLAALVIIMLQQVISGVNYVHFAISRALSLDVVTEEMIDEGKATVQQVEKQQYIEVTKNSDDFRNMTMQQLKAMISERPVFGHGLGASISYREDGLVEYFYHDNINKTGIVGLALYLLPIGLILLTFFRVLIIKQNQMILLGIVGVCGLFAFLVSSYFNPYMNAALGISCYAVALGCFHRISCEIRDNKQSTHEVAEVTMGERAFEQIAIEATERADK